jgi:phage antirepressor YoqD-like protein
MNSLTDDKTSSYISFVAHDDAASQEGGEPVERLTVEMARRIVGEVLERRDMPRKKKAADEDEIDALVDDLDDEIEDVEEDDDDDLEDDVEEDEEDPDEAPKKSRRSRKAKTSKAKAEVSGVGTTEVAEAAGIEPRQLRMYLRANDVQTDREGRYNWSSLNAKEVQRILKDIKQGAVAKLNKEKLDSLKGKKAAKKSSAKKSTAKKRRTARK